MKLLNLGCGSQRPGSPWINVDSLRTILPEGSPERFQIDAMHNYVEADLRAPLPFATESMDGCLLSHILEHFDAPEGLRLLQECHRVLVPGGVVLVSVPDASYFRRVYPEDRNENWPELFDQTDPANPIPTFFEAALWFNEHKAILTEDAVWCYLTRAQFAVVPAAMETPAARVMWPELNRGKFSAVMAGIKA